MSVFEIIAVRRTMRKCYEYQTSKGRFYIVRHENRYHAVYSGVSICNCNCAAEVAAVLSYGYKFKLLGTESSEIDTSDLGIPVDLSDWISCYFIPDDIRMNFTHNSDPPFQKSE
jgi:hypothetical protein